MKTPGIHLRMSVQSPPRLHSPLSGWIRHHHLPLIQGSKKGKYEPATALECVICFDYAVSPIRSCTLGGHVVCSLCYDMLAGDKGKNKQCPICPSALELNALAERMAENMEIKVSCKFVEDGCKERALLTTKVVQHEQGVCYYRPVDCYQLGCENQGRPTVMSMKDYIKHLDEKHARTKSALHYLRSSPNGSDRGTTVIFPLCDYKGESFLLFVTLETKVVNFHVKILSDEEKANKYKCKVKFVSCNNDVPFMKASFVLPVVPFHSTVDTSHKGNLNFGSFNRKRLSALGRGVEGEDTKEILVRASVRMRSIV